MKKRRRCIICQQIYSTGRNTGRRRGTVTCSHKCAGIYLRVVNRILAIKNGKQKKTS